MSYGKMNTVIEIIGPQTVVDSAGFSTNQEAVLARVRAYREGRHGNQKWANRATFTDATELFRFRRIPDLPITTSMIISCDGHFEITSVENVRGKGMYQEVLAREVAPTGTPQSRYALWGEDEHRNE